MSEPDLARDATYYRASDALKRRVVDSLAAAERTERRPAWGRALGFAAALAAVAVASWNLALLHVAGPGDANVAREVVAAHVRSLMGEGKLNDVASSDQHTVKPWFTGRLDYAPPVKDLAASGFPLLGGRLDFIDGRPVAALTYKRRLHTVNVFVWPGKDARDRPVTFESINGFAVARWARGGMQYWAVSDTSPDDLAKLAAAIP